MAKQLAFSQEARGKIARGIEQLTEAVAVTMGPRGRNAEICHQLCFGQLHGRPGISQQTPAG